MFVYLDPCQIGIWKCWFLRVLRKTSQSKGKNQQQTQHPHIMLTPWFEPRPHWWEVSALTTVPSLYLNLQIVIFLQYFYLNSFIVMVCLCVRLKKLEQNTPVIICCNCPLGRLLKCIQFHKPKPTLLLVFLLHQIPDQIRDILGETTQNVSTIYRYIYTMQLKCKWLNERLGVPEHVHNSNFW